MNFTTITEDQFCDILKSENLEIDTLAKALVEKLSQKNLKVAVAESCTGGLISKQITDTPGASAVYDCGVCSYANSIKEKLLGVSAETLKSFGAVSPQTAAEMAQGVRILASADIGISTTGIAGPDGGTKEKPVGTIFIAVAKENSTHIFKADFTAKNNNRCKNRQLATALAIYCGLAVFKPF